MITESSNDNHFVLSDSIVATKALSDLKVWIEQPLPGGLPGWLLNDTFRKNLKIALLGGYVLTSILN